jgi:hypothetical protein
MAAGTASINTSALGVGDHVITAIYSGDVHYSPANSSIPVSVQVTQAQTSTSLAASVTAQGTMLTANVVVTSPGSPPLAGTVAFYDGSTLLGTAPLSDGSATFNAGDLPPGSHTFTALFTGDGTTSASTTAVTTSTANPMVAQVARYGFHQQPTYVVLTFSAPLDPATAQDVANYSLVGPLGHHGVASYAVGIESAVYNPATNTVTLTFQGHWNVHWKWRLTVNGATAGGVKGVSGAPLHGSGGGSTAQAVGSNFVTTISMPALAGPARKRPSAVRPAARAAIVEARPQLPAARPHGAGAHAAKSPLLGAIARLFRRR